MSPAQSFKAFLESPNFSDFKRNDRGDFFQYVRNAILHNGETRKDWKIRIDTKRMLERDPKTKTRTINRRLFHAAVLREFRALRTKLRNGDPQVREQFLRRIDAMAGFPIEALKSFYFAYGSNLLDAECKKTAPDAQGYAVAFLPGYRLAFTKHAKTRRGDAATIVQDPTSMVWGYVYRVHDRDRKHLNDRERGYDDIEEITVYLRAPRPEDDPTPNASFTFIAREECPGRCGPPSDYLDIVIEGAKERDLPKEYQQMLLDLRNRLPN